MFRVPSSSEVLVLAIAIAVVAVVALFQVWDYGIGVQERAYLCVGACCLGLGGWVFASAARMAAPSVAIARAPAIMIQVAPERTPKDVRFGYAIGITLAGTAGAEFLLAFSIVGVILSVSTLGLTTAMWRSVRRTSVA